jgi:hypothetical protein
MTKQIYPACGLMVRHRQQQNFTARFSGIQKFF